MARAVGPRRRVAFLLGPASLALGFAMGAWVHQTGSHGLVEILSPIGTLWTNALKVAVVPLAVCMVVVGINSLPTGKGLGRWGLATVLVFVAMLVSGAILALAVCPAYLHAFLGEQGRQGSPAAAPVAGAGLGSWSDWLTSMVPPNLIEVLAKGDMLPIVVVSILFGLAIRQLGGERLRSILGLFEAGRDAMLVYVRWVIAALPLGAFCLAFSFAARSGLEVAAPTLHFVFFTFGVMLVYVLFLYVAVGIFGRVGFRRFAIHAWPSQEVAIGSRSSIAALPTMVEGARTMGLPEPSFGLVLPMGVALLKANRTLSAITKLFFAVQMFGGSLDTPHVLAFVATVMLLSVATPGVPSAGSAMTLGAYVSAGASAEGILILDATNALTDIVKTVVNVTANLAAAAIVPRFSGRADPPDA